MGFIIGVLKIIILLGTLITIHECGHFLMARLFKVKVLKFSIGFGPIVFKKIKGDTEYSLRLIPFGGFVQMEGEETRSDDKDAFNKKPVWQRILVVAAGAIVNIIFALLIYFSICSIQNAYVSSIITDITTNDYFYEVGLRSGDEIISVNNKRTLTGNDVQELISSSKTNDINFVVKRTGKKVNVPVNIPYTTRGIIGVGFVENGIISVVYEGMPAYESGILVYDKVIMINGITMNNTEEIVASIQSMPNESITLTVLRDGLTKDVNINTLSEEDRYFDLSYEIINPSFFKGLKYAINETNWYLGANLKAYGNLFLGKAENVEVMGVVGIASEISKTSALSEFFYMMCAISLSLGIFNLFPIPALDGGRILLLIIEGIRRKPLSEKLEQGIILAGFLIIIIFAIIVTFFDVSKLFI